jgi:hypothetical protein
VKILQKHNVVCKYFLIIYYSNIFLVIIIGFFIFLQILALIKMIVFYKHLKFENIVIGAGIIICAFILFELLTSKEFFYIISTNLQLFIILYIIRRLSRILFHQNEDYKCQVYQM